MNRLMISLSAVALMAGAAHANQAPDVTEGETPEVTAKEAGNAISNAAKDAADATGDALEATGNAIEDAAEATGDAIDDTAVAISNGLKEVDVADATYVHPQDGTFSARDILGATIYSSKGEIAARVDDVWINADGDVTAFLVNEGGFLGLGEDDVALNTGSVTFSADNSSNVSGYIGLTEDQLETIADSRYDAKVEYRGDTESYTGLTLEDHVLGKAVVNSKGEKIASVRDVLLSRDGKVTHLVLAQGGLLGFGGDLVAARVDGLTFEEGDSEGALVMATTAKELMDMPEFRYHMGASVAR